MFEKVKRLVAKIFRKKAWLILVGLMILGTTALVGSSQEKAVAKNNLNSCDSGLSVIACQQLASNHDAGLTPTGGLPDNPCGGVADLRDLATNFLGWVVCEGLGLVTNLLETFEGIIYDILIVSPSDYCGAGVTDRTSPACNYQKAWSNLRNFASIFIFITALFMVISTAVDAGLFSNYTVKKYLARLVVCAILLQFSWHIGDIMIQISTSFGQVINAMLMSAFDGADTITLEHIFASFGNTDPATAIGASAVGAGFTALLVSKGILGVAIMLIFGAFSLLIGLLVLIIRRMLIIGLLIFSPIGLSFWILPGDDKLWDIYRKTAVGLLIMYPMIIIIFSLGRIFAWMSIQPGNDASTLAGLVIYFLMFAALPMTFKMTLKVLDRFGLSANILQNTLGKAKQATQKMSDRRHERRRLEGRGVVRGGLIRGRHFVSDWLAERDQRPFRTIGNWIAEPPERRQKRVEAWTQNIVAAKSYSNSAAGNQRIVNEILNNVSTSAAQKQAAVRVLAGRGQDGLIRQHIDALTGPLTLLIDGTPSPNGMASISTRDRALLNQWNSADMQIERSSLFRNSALDLLPGSRVVPTGSGLRNTNDTSYSRSPEDNWVQTVSPKYVRECTLSALEAYLRHGGQGPRRIGSVNQVSVKQNAHTIAKTSAIWDNLSADKKSLIEDFRTSGSWW